MKKRIPKELIIGLFTVIVIAGCYLGFLFLKNKKIFSDDIVLYAVFNQADGLEVSSPVLVNGYRIGTVENIGFNIASRQLIVQFSIDGKYDIPSTSMVHIASTNLLGGKVLQMTLGSVDAESFANGDTVKSSTQRNMLDIAGEEYDKLKEQAGQLLGKLNSALEGINRALSKQNTDALSATLNNIENLSSDLRQVVSQEKGSLTSAIENLNVLSKSLREAAPDLQRGITNLAKLSDSIAVSGPSLVRNAALSVDNLNGILAKIAAGEGSVGKLVNDEQLYVNINETLANLSLLLEDFKVNPKKYINVTVFGKKERVEKPSEPSLK